MHRQSQHGRSEPISVILPYYNRAETLPRAVLSVLNQSHEQLIVYLVNDGSTDESRAVARSFDDPRVVHLDLQANGGAAHARNAGLAAATTDLVSFMDSDDAWCENKVATQLRYLRDAQQQDRDIAVVGCGWRIAGSTRPPAGDFPAGPFSRVDVHTKVRGIGTPMILVDRAVAAENSVFDQSLPALLDRDYVMSCLANRTKVIVVPEILALVSRGRADHVASSRRVAHAIEKLMAKYEHDLFEAPALRSWYSFRAAREHLLHRDYPPAFSHLRTALADNGTRRLIHLGLGSVGGRKGFSLAQRVMPVS